MEKEKDATFQTDFSFLFIVRLIDITQFAMLKYIMILLKSSGKVIWKAHGVPQ